MSLDEAFEALAAEQQGMPVTEEGLLDIPGSLVLDEEDNKVLRMPNKEMHMRSQVELNRMLFRIRSEPHAFKDLIRQRRKSCELDDCVDELVIDGSFSCSSNSTCTSPCDSPCLSPTRELSKEQVQLKYNVTCLAGKGSFSTVYYAIERKTQRAVALKCVHLTQIGSRKSVQEIQVLQSVQHANIIACKEYFYSDQKLFIVLEWAAGGDLKRMLHRVRLSKSRFHENVIWTYFAQIANAVQHMHECNLIHRDIKPANIFIFPNGTLKLGDMGLTRVLSEDTLKAYSKVGTPLYMPPEVLQGKGQDFKSDIWSTGCVLYEIAMLHTPFEVGCKTMRNLFMRILKGDYSAVSPHFSSSLHSTIRDLLNVNSARRPSASQLVSFVASQLASPPKVSISLSPPILSPSPTKAEKKLVERASQSISLPIRHCPVTP